MYYVMRITKQLDHVAIQPAVHLDSPDRYHTQMRLLELGRKVFVEHASLPTSMCKGIILTAIKTTE